MSHDAFEPDYIAVEGVIGVGKTTFAQMLAERLGARLLNEEVFENPFLVDFYKDRKRHALSCQLYFLITRFQQQQDLMVRDLFDQKIVADYLFAKDAIFASVNLSERELALYNKIAPALSRDVPAPDLVIYLQASTPVLLDRIRRRNLSFEKPIDFDYVAMLNTAYDYYFFHYTDSPLLVVKTDEIDFVHRPEHFDDLIEQISKPVAGKKYYSPSSGTPQSGN
jgi:deoxyguanosine kinase